MPIAPPPVITQELQIVDPQGQPRIVLSAKTGAPSLDLLRADGETSARVALDPAGRPSVKLSNPDPKGPMAAIEIDDKGAHVKFDRPGGASSYLFLNNAGVSGLVLVDPQGVRRLNVVLGADGDVSIVRFGADGKPLP
jgi:hypothetical protein